MKKKETVWYCRTCRHKRSEERRLPMAILMGVEWGGCGCETDGKICGKTKIKVREGNN